MLLEYYTVRLKDAAPGKGFLHITQYYDDLRSAVRHFEKKHPGEKIVAYKHEIKKGPKGPATFKKTVMFGEDKVTESVSLSGGYGSGNHEKVNESTRSFKTLMRSIEDKKSIKNLKVPSPSERNPDGSLRVKEEPKKLSEAKTASGFTHIVHALGDLGNPALEHHLKKNNGDFYKNSDKGAFFKFKSKNDAQEFKNGLKTSARGIYTDAIYPFKFK